MKKRITGILATLACLTFVTGCSNLEGALGQLTDKIPGLGNLFGKEEVIVDAEGAADFLFELYVDKNVTTTRDYTVPTTFKYLGTDYNVEWASNVKDVTIKAGNNEFDIVDVNELLAENLDYTLTATLSYKDKSASTTFDRIVKALDSQVAAPITAAPVENTAYKFYVYQGANMSHRYVNGKMQSTYYFATSDNFNDGIDLYVEAVEGKTGSFYLYHNAVVTEATEDTEAVTAKTYINTREVLGGDGNMHVNSFYETLTDNANPTEYTYDTDWNTIITKVNNKKYYFGCDGTYNTVEPQEKTGEGYYMGYLVSMINRSEVSADEKIAQTIIELGLKKSYVGENAITLEHIGVAFPDVAMSYTVSEGATLTKGLLTDTLSFNPTEKTAITFDVTFTCGETTKTESFNFDIIPEYKSATEIVNAAYALAENEALPIEVTLTGVINKVNTAYDPGYSNVTVTIIVEDLTDKPIMCYRLKGEGADVIKVNDTITVTGKIKNYKGTIEFDAGCILDSYVPGEGENEGEEPETPDEPSETTTIAAIVAGELGDYTAAGVVVAKNARSFLLQDSTGAILVYLNALPAVNVGDKVTVSGTTTTYGAAVQFGAGATVTANGTETVTAPEAKALTIAECEAYFAEGVTVSPLYITLTGTLQISGNYMNLNLEGTTKAVGSLTYALDADKEALTALDGKVIKVDGYLTGISSGKYLNIMFTKYEAVTTPDDGGDDSSSEGEGEVTPPAGETEFVIPEAGKAYAFGMTQANLENKVYYLAGGMDGYYMATTDNAENAIATYIEETTGGYYFYTMVDGVKTYINMVVNGTHVNGAFDATASTVYTIDETNKTLIAVVNDTEYWFGTRNDKTYTTMGPCAVSYAGFFGKFYAMNESGNEGGNDNTGNEGEVTPPAGETEFVIPEVGKAYAFGMTQANLENKVYYLAGGMDGYYMATTDNAENAIATYIEETTGGYYFYTMVDGVKTYINMVVNGTHVNGAFDATASTVYTIDETNKTLIAVVNDTEYWFGTRNDKTYTTMGPCAVSYAGFFGKFYAMNESGNEGGNDNTGNEGDNDMGTEDDEPTTPTYNVLATFEFGDNGDAAHVDGNGLGTSVEYTVGDYTLSLTGLSKVYGPAFDAKGNSCIKLGTSTVVGTFSFTVADDVDSVIIKVAKYKANNTKVNVNGTEYTVDKASNDGEYMEIVIDTTTTKTVTLTTVSGACRAMINSITFYGIA